MKSVLIVEDDQPTAAVIACAMPMCGLERVKVVHSVPEAIEALSKEFFDVIVIDYLLDTSTAAYVFPHVNPASHVLLITAALKLPDELTAQADDTLYKPFGLEEICEKLKAS